MQNFGEKIAKTLEPEETPEERDIWDDTPPLSPEAELPTSGIPDDVPEADLLDQNRPA